MPESVQLSETKRKLLAKYLLGQMHVRRNTQAIPRRTPNEPIPLSYAQEQVWLHAQMAPDVPLYNEPVTIHYTGVLDVAALGRSFNEILRRHEAWRSCFVLVDGQPMQKVEPHITVSFPVIDLRGLPEEQRNAEAVRIATEDARIPLDLERAPLFRVKLIQLDHEEYRLYLTLSHIIFDGVAIYQVLLPELTALYDAFSAGKPSTLAELPIQYPDYAVWQRSNTRADKAAKDIAYWRQQLQGQLPSLYLPVDRPRNAAMTFRGSMYPFSLNKDLTEGLRAFSQLEGVSLFHILLAGFAILLHRYSGEELIPIGSVSAGRETPETERLLGYFLNTVVFRADLGGDLTFQQLVKRVRTASIEMLEHDTLPFELLVKELKIPRNPSQNPIFQALISIEPRLPELNSAWRLTQLDIDTGATKHDLNLEFDERSDEILARFHYSTDLFDGTTVIRMVDHLRTLLEGAIVNSEQRISQLPILTPDEEHRILVGWNETAAAYSNGNQSLHQIVEEQVERNAEAVAIVFGESKLSYRELNKRANQLAWRLKRSGVGPDVLVGVLAERSLEMVVALLGVLKAGGAYVPIDPDYPPDRVAFMLEDAGAPVLLTQARFSDRLPRHKGETLCLDRDWDQISRENASNPPNATTLDHLAYMIYTSGSTGRPKGAMNTHRGICNRLLWMQDQYGLTEADTILQKTPFSFDVSVWEFFWPLLVGARLVLTKPGGHRDAAYLVELIREQRVTVLHFVPSMLGIFLEEPGVEGCRSLRHVICSGEALPFNLQEQFFKLLPAQLHNLYGPTEAAVDVTHWTCQRDSERNLVPIGRPVANTQIYVLDRNMQPVPIGVPGELYIGGVQVGRGYHNRPELTAERFLPDPFSGEPEARIYKTGDLCRWLPDGTVEYLGRMDFQVKIRGQRIELGEVESVLGDHEAVKQCVVVVRENTLGDPMLVAYFEPRSGRAPEVADLRAHLKKQLPDYMVPSAFAVMEKLPLTPNGKIDRKALPTPDQGRIEIKDRYVAPHDPIEQILTQLWAKVLRVRRVGVHDNFFELGGHSLLAVRVAVEIEERFKKRLPLATLLQAPTISALAEVLRKEQWKPSWKSLVPVQPGGSKPPLFLMHSHGGNVLEYHSLVSHMDADQPVYALQARGLDGLIPKNQSIEEMAAAYVDEVKSLQPGGPYFVGGFCFGGLLALEAAQQLSAAGDEVALVVLIQTMHAGAFQFVRGTPLLRRWWNRTTKRIDLERENFLHRGAGYIGERGRHILDIAGARSAIALDHAVGNGSDGRARSSIPYILQSLAIEHRKAYKRYVPHLYAGEVVLFRASKQLRGLIGNDLDLGWHGLLHGNLDVCEVPGHQQNILLEPNVSFLAKELSSRLQATQERCVPAVETSLAAVSA